MTLTILWFIRRNINIGPDDATARSCRRLKSDSDGTFGWGILDVVCVPGDCDRDAGKGTDGGEEGADVASSGGLRRFEDDKTDDGEEEIEGVDVTAALEFIGDISRQKDIDTGADIRWDCQQLCSIRSANTTSGLWKGTYCALV